MPAKSSKFTMLELSLILHQMQKCTRTSNNCQLDLTLFGTDGDTSKQQGLGADIN